MKKLKARKNYKVDSPTIDHTLRNFIWVIGLGASLVAYAHGNFSSKYEVRSIKEDVKEDISEIKGLMKDFNTAIMDIHRVHYPYQKEGKSEQRKR